VIESLRSRCWLVANSGNRNELGQDPSHKLVPGSNVLNFSDAEASVTQRAALATRHRGSPPTIPMSGSRRVITPTSTRAELDYRHRRRPTARSRTLTSCCGIPSALTTSPGPETGRHAS
jgi:hypothetical protein